MSIHITRPVSGAGYVGLSAWRAAYGARRQSPVNIVSIGSSSVYGSGATVLQERFVDRMAALLAARDGLTCGRHSLAVEASAGGWTESGTITSDTRGLGLATRRLAAAATLSRTDTCTGWTLQYVQGPGAGAFSITVDGGAPVTITPDTTGTAERHDGTWSSGVLTSGSHTLLITATGAVAISGVYIHTGDSASGVRSWCSGKGGTTASTWAAAGQSLWHRIATLQPALVTMLIGPNDYSASVGPISFEASVRSTLASLRATVSPMPSILLIGTFRRLDTGFTPAYSWEAYTGALARIAADNSSWCSYLDIGPDFPGSKLENQASGLVSTADYLHQTSAGHQLTADRVVEALTAAPPAAVTRESFGAHWVPGLLADYDPHTLTASLADGASVASLTPTWGLERAPLVQATAEQQPTLAYGSIAGRASLRFVSGNSQSLDTGLWTATRGIAASGKSVLVVFRPTGTLANWQTIFTGSISASGVYAKAQYTSSTIMSVACGGDADTAIQYTTPVDTWCAQIVVFNGASSGIYRLPGTSSDRSGTTGTGATAGLAGLRLGGHIAGGGWISMDLARICVWDRALTTDQISRLLEWISSLYGISLT